jgi:hypothetical protein
LKHFYKKDLENKASDEKMYVKAYYIHHLLDYFRETRYNTQNFDLVFEKFLQEKVIDKILSKEGIEISFQNEINSIFRLIKKNKNLLLDDLEGNTFEEIH